MSYYIYLLQLQHFIATNQSIYKLGKNNIDDAKTISKTLCNDPDILFDDIIDSFKIKYSHRPDFGEEFFEGNHLSMIKDITEKTIIHQNMLDYKSLSLHCFDNHDKPVVNNTSRLSIEEIKKLSREERLDYNRRMNNERQKKCRENNPEKYRFYHKITKITTKPPTKNTISFLIKLTQKLTGPDKSSFFLTKEQPSLPVHTIPMRSLKTLSDSGTYILST